MATLRDIFADCRSRNKGSRILFIADQFEEAFTLLRDDAVKDHFIEVLLDGFRDPATGTAPDICLMLAMRADFYGRALRHRLLADALQDHVENLGPMRRDPIIAAKTGDAELRPAPGLFSQMLRQLLNGYTVGLAMDNFRRRFAHNAMLLLSQLTTQKPGDGSRVLVNETLATLDIRNYVIIGDPAVSTPARRAELQ